MLGQQNARLGDSAPSGGHPVGRFSFRRVALIVWHFARRAELFSRWFSGRSTLSLMVAERRRRPRVVRVSLLAGPSMYARVGAGQTDLQTLLSIWANDRYCPLTVVDGTTIIDAGANVGYSAVWFASRFPRSQVIAIEPDAENVRLLRKNVADFTNVTVVHAAVGATSGTTSLVDPGRGAWGYRTWVGDEAVPGQAVTVRESVRVVSIGDVLDEFGVRSVGLVKIDIEGAELEVFERAAAWVDRADAVMVELHDRFRPGCRAAFEAATAGFAERFELGEHSFAVRGRGNPVVSDPS